MSGFDFASVMNSPTVLAGTEGMITSAVGTVTRTLLEAIALNAERT
jgi:hypothetical protein